MPLVRKYQSQARDSFSPDLSKRDKERELWHLESIFAYVTTLDASLKRKPAKNVRKALEGGECSTDK